MSKKLVQEKKQRKPFKPLTISLGDKIKEAFKRKTKRGK